MVKKAILALAALGGLGQLWAYSGQSACLQLDLLSKSGGSCKPLEMYKGLGSQDGMIDFPVVNAPAAGAFLQTGVGCERMALIFIT